MAVAAWAGGAFRWTQAAVACVTAAARPLLRRAPAPCGRSAAPPRPCRAPGPAVGHEEWARQGRAGPRLSGHGHTHIHTHRQASPTSNVASGSTTSPDPGCLSAGQRSWQPHCSGSLAGAVVSRSALYCGSTWYWSSSSFSGALASACGEILEDFSWLCWAVDCGKQERRRDRGRWRGAGAVRAACAAGLRELRHGLGAPRAAEYLC